MVVLLREVNVPARLVNGFKVSEWNPISETYIVRQQHAHSWVEAYLRPYGWRTFDPTAASRDAATPAPMFARRIGGNVYDWVDSLWVAYVLNFDSSRQASPYGWLRKIAGLSEAVTASGPLEHFGIGLGASRLQPTDLGGPLYAVLLGIRWIVALLLGVGLVWVIARGFGGWRKRERRAPRRFKFYARMERMLRRRGFRRAGAQTPWEFSAALAGRQLAGRRGSRRDHRPVLPRPLRRAPAHRSRPARDRAGAAGDQPDALTRRAAVIYEEQTMSDLKAGFSLREWERIRQDYTAWWRGELDRPLVNAQRGRPGGLEALIVPDELAAGPVRR